MAAFVMSAALIGVVVSAQEADRSVAAVPQQVPQPVSTTTPEQHHDHAAHSAVPNKYVDALARGVVLKVHFTAYCTCAVCTGKFAIAQRTATGERARLAKPGTPSGAAAAWWLLPPNTLLAGTSLPGMVRRINDTGGGMRKSARRGRYHVDLLFTDHRSALRFGKLNEYVLVTFPFISAALTDDQREVIDTALAAQSALPSAIVERTRATVLNNATSCSMLGAHCAASTTSPDVP